MITDTHLEWCDNETNEGLMVYKGREILHYKLFISYTKIVSSEEHNFT